VQHHDEGDHQDREPEKTTDQVLGQGRAGEHYGPTVPFTTALEGKSNWTEPHFAGPLVTHCWMPPSGPVSFPGVAHIFAVYVPGFAKTD
jgi:hypothetical protein